MSKYSELPEAKKDIKRKAARDRYYLTNEDEEVKKKRSEKAKEKRDKETPEQREKRLAYNREYYANRIASMTPEELEAHKARYRKEPKPRPIRSEEEIAAAKAERKAYQEDWRKDRAKANKLFIKEYKLANPCIFCGEGDPVALDFHHVDPSTKEGKICLITHHKALSTVMREVDKCVVLCANCHRKFHAGVIDLSPVLPAKFGNYRISPQGETAEQTHQLQDGELQPQQLPQQHASP